MQIVIDIPNEEVPNSQEIIDISLHFIDGEVCECTYPYTVLPKGHGKLIDINEITAFRELECNGHDVESLDEFTVIIEADQAESEG